MSPEEVYLKTLICYICKSNVDAVISRFQSEYIHDNGIKYYFRFGEKTYCSKCKRKHTINIIKKFLTWGVAQR